MISKKDAPVAWAMRMYDLDDAREDLESLLAQMQDDPAFDEACFRIRLGHIYWHLNRAWNCRNVLDDQLENIDANAGRFPDDIAPI
jgi:hypothetical protein